MWMVMREERRETWEQRERDRGEREGGAERERKEDVGRRHEKLVI
jgi:hypothetical protein